MDTRIVPSRATDPGAIPVTLEVNGAALSLPVSPYVTLLDLLRERLQLTGTKNGCDHGQCGARTFDGEAKVTGSRVMTHNFADYHVPLNADIPEIADLRR